MAQPLELQIVELLVSRLCHDLVGPVGAVANGVELLATGEGSVDPEVVQLIAQSSRTASQRLQFFRVALGSGSAPPDSGRVAELRRLAQGMFDALDHVTLDWPLATAEIEAAFGRGAIKTVLNLTAIALDALPRGGVVRVLPAVASGRLRIVIAASGSEARLAADLRAGLDGGLATTELTPRNLLGYLVGRMTSEAGGRLTIRGPDRGRLEMTLDLPPGV